MKRNSTYFGFLDELKIVLSWNVYFKVVKLVTLTEVSSRSV